MKKILVISGSRADYGLLEWPAKALSEVFEVEWLKIWGASPDKAFKEVRYRMEFHRPDAVLILGDRHEVLEAAIAAHLYRVPIAHIAGGDVTEGSYDDAMRDCISRLSMWHFPTSEESATRLRAMGCKFVQMIGNVALDELFFGEWKGERPIARPYVVVDYQPETLDGTDDTDMALRAIKGRYAVLFLPNVDAGSEGVRRRLHDYAMVQEADCVDYMPRKDFLNLIYHCDEFIGNSSSMFYEAPFLGVKSRVIGKRQKGRVIPKGDGKASERIRDALCQAL